MNPYATQLGNRNPITVVGTTAGKLEAHLRRLGARVKEPRAPGKWSPREIVCHLADCEIVWAYRIRQGLGERHHVIQPFDQNPWAERYATYAAEQAMAVFTALRAWNVALIGTLTPEEMAKQAWHPDYGVLTVGDIVGFMAGHDRNHLAQFEELASETS